MKTEFIATDVEVQNNKINILYNKKLEHSPAYILFLKTHADLIDEGLRYPVTTWKEKNNEILYCTIDDKPVGFINYLHFKDYQLVILDMCFVIPEYRNQGIFKIMFRHLEKILKDRGVDVLRIDLPVNNEYLEKIFKELGFSLLFYSLHKKVN
jgi:GNAT superfamily N-acetyltransferase